MIAPCSASPQQLQQQRPSNDDTDKQLQTAYMDGTATLDDMLACARSFAANALPQPKLV